MACACGKGNVKQVWVYHSKDGTTKEYTSEVQARAAVIRAGGGRITVKQ
jgi:hypothetical protein